jgi:hypothetical protein
VRLLCLHIALAPCANAEQLGRRGQKEVLGQDLICRISNVEIQRDSCHEW